MAIELRCLIIRVILQYIVVTFKYLALRGGFLWKNKKGLNIFFIKKDTEFGALQK